MPEDKEVITPQEGVALSEKATDVKEEFAKNEVNFSAALAEKNREKQALKGQLAEKEAELERLKSENELLKTFNEPTSDSDTEIADLKKQITDLTTFKKSLEETSKEEELKKQKEEITLHCENIKTAKDENGNLLYPDFNESEILISLYERTGGILKDLSQIEDEYLLLKTKKQRESEKLQKARQKATTESPSNVSAPSEKTPSNVDEGFEIYRRQKK
jgi:hypothetical protein